ncbi:MAG: FAD-binding oxidoreductase [Kiritimatiellia bacterium]
MPHPPATFIADVARHFPDGLRDESRRTGTAEGIAFPATVEEVCDLLRLAAKQERPVTIQGARTGITAGAVPDGGVVLSLTRLDRILGVSLATDGRACVRVQPGVTLTAVRAFLDGASIDTSNWSEASRQALPLLRAARWIFTPDPTESSASLGGMAACNASGACSFAYGATRRHIHALTVALADGDLLDLERGVQRAEGRQFRMTTRGGRVLSGAIPTYEMPAVKNAAGYYAAQDMDLIDLFIGSEGTLGAIVEIDLALQPLPPVTWGVICFLPDEPCALNLVEWIRDPKQRTGGAQPVAIEYFDAGVLDLLRQARAGGVHLPQLKDQWNQAVYVEYAAASEALADERGTALAEWLTAHGGSAEDTWISTGEEGLRRIKEFRHAAPEQVNRRIAERQRQHPGLTKLGTDLSVPDAQLRPVMAMYRRDLAEAGLEYVVFGHIGNNHVHVNILPRDLQEYAQGKALYETWARQVVAWEGSVSAEHGIGKLKVNLLALMAGSKGVAEMRALKRVFDPAGRLNAGNLFAAAASSLHDGR